MEPSGMCCFTQVLAKSHHLGSTIPPMSHLRCKHSRRVETKARNRKALEWCGCCGNTTKVIAHCFPSKPETYRCGPRCQKFLNKYSLLSCFKQSTPPWGSLMH